MPQITYMDDETKQQITREMNPEELAQYEKDQAEWANLQAEREAKKIAKQALLKKLGITEDEAKLLLS